MAGPPRPAASREISADEGNGGFLGYLNQGIASTLGAPVDLANAGLGLVGLGSEEPFGGSRVISRGMQRLGVSTANPGERPDTLGEYVGQGVGGAVGAMLPAAGAVSLAARSASPVAQGVASTVSRPYLATPGRALAAEVGAGAGAGAGASVANQLAPDSTAAQLGGALAGGLVGGMAPAMARRVVEASPVTGTALRMASAEIAPFTKAGATERARRRMSGLSEDRALALSRLQEPSIGNLSMAARTGDRRLMAMEQAVRDQEPTIDASMRARETASGNTLREEFAAPSQGRNARDTQAFNEARISRLVTQMNDRVALAERTAQQRVSALAPNQRQSQASTVVREELESAHRAARNQERELWRQVPREAMVPTTGARQSYQTILADLSRAQRDDIPAVARDLLSEGGNQTFRPEESVREVHGLYSALRQESRNARAGDTPNANRARISDTLADALLADMQSVQGASAPLREALDFSREVNTTFRRGSVGRILGNERTGGDRVAPESTLDVSMGRSGARGGTGMDEINRARGANDASPAMTDYVLGQVEDAAIREGTIRPARAETFMRSNRDVLDRMPQVRGMIDQAVDATNTAQRTSDRMQVRSRAVQNPRTSTAAAFGNARQGEEIQSILRSQRPGQMAAQLARQAGRDPTGRAASGLKGALLDDMIGRARMQSFDDMGAPLISGKAIQASLSDPKYGEVASAILSPTEMKRMDRIAEEFGRIETMKGRLPDVGDIMGDEPNSVIAYMARVIAARQGAALGQGTSGASLQTAQMASTRMKRFLDRMTNDRAEALIKRAITGDEDLFAALLSDGRNLSRVKETRIIESLAGLGGYAAASAGQAREGDQ